MVHIFWEISKCFFLAKIEKNDSTRCSKPGPQMTQQPSKNCFDKEINLKPLWDWLYDTWYYITLPLSIFSVNNLDENRDVLNK